MLILVSSKNFEMKIEILRQKLKILVFQNENKNVFFCTKSYEKLSNLPPAHFAVSYDCMVWL
jgi:hypothetical protein